MGKWLLYVTIFTFADMLRSGVVHVALIQMYANKKDATVSGSAWLISLCLTVIISFSCYSVYYLLPNYIHQLHLISFILYFPVLFCASLPYTIALWIQQAENKFNCVLYIRLFLSIPVFAFISSGLIYPFDVQLLIKAHIFFHSVASLMAIIFGWTNIRSIIKAKIETIKALLQFGKYSMGTLICSNLLKSADTFLISWYLGPTAVAAYSLPYKLIELIEIPLRSIVATSLPGLSAFSQQKNFTKVQQIFNENTGLLSIAIVPLVMVGFLSADELIALTGGKQYAAISADIFRVFALYSLLLPLDRFIGITLDSISKPHLNLVKVLLMVLVNITGNIIVLELFNSPLPVAFTTLLTTCCGITFGIFALNKTFPFNGKKMLGSGYQLILSSIYKSIYTKVL